MSKIPGWTRKEELETGDTEYLWHEDMGEQRELRVTKVRGRNATEYKIWHPANPPQREEVLKYKDKQQEAYDWAVDYMRDENPEPSYSEGDQIIWNDGGREEIIDVRSSQVGSDYTYKIESLTGDDIHAPGETFTVDEDDIDNAVSSGRAEIR